MTLDLAALRAQHRTYPSSDGLRCARCLRRFPCDAILAADRIEALEAERQLLADVFAPVPLDELHIYLSRQAARIAALEQAVEFASREFRRLGRENCALQMENALRAALGEASDD